MTSIGSRSRPSRGRRADGDPGRDLRDDRRDPQAGREAERQRRPERDRRRRCRLTNRGTPCAFSRATACGVTRDARRRCNESTRRETEGHELRSSRALDSLPPSFDATVAALHRVAERVVSPARKPRRTRSRWQPTPGGFGTPAFEHGGLRSRSAWRERSWSTSRRRRGATSAAHARSSVARRIVADLCRRTPPRATSRSTSIPRRPRARRVAMRSAPRCSMQLATTAASDDAHAGPALARALRPRDRARSGAAGGARTTASRPATSTHPEPYAYVGPWTAEVAASCGRRPASRRRADLRRAAGGAGPATRGARLLRHAQARTRRDARSRHERQRITRVEWHRVLAAASCRRAA